ncbi:MAG: TetR/AcrR family transcriptional regulator [Myxococcota bacterium]
MSDDKRERLLLAAKTALARDGLGVSVAAIAREGGITPGLVHYYFPSKHALIVEVFERLGRDFAARLPDASGPPAAQVRGFVERALALGTDADVEGVRLWGWLAAEALHDEDIRGRMARVMEGWMARLTQALAALGTEDPSGLAGAVVSGVLGAWQLGAVAPGVLPAGSAVGAQRRLVEGLLAAQEVPRG